MDNANQPLASRHSGFFSQYEITFAENFARGYAALAPGEAIPPGLQGELAQTYAALVSGQPFDLDRSAGGPTAGLTYYRALTAALGRLAEDFGRHLAQNPVGEALADLTTLLKLNADLLYGQTESTGTQAQDEVGGPPRPAGRTAAAEVAGISAEAREIIAAFDAARQAGSQVRFFNLYKGAAVPYPATVLEIDRGTVKFRVHRYQAVALDTAGGAYISADALARTVKGTTLWIGWQKQIAMLADFRYVDSSPIQRAFVRVQPRDFIPISLGNNDHPTLGRLADISVRAAAVIVDSPAAVRVGKDYQLRFNLPIGPHKAQKGVTVRARVQQIGSRENPSLVVLTLQPNTAADATISRYMFLRQVEIMRELQGVAVCRSPITRDAAARRPEPADRPADG